MKSSRIVFALSAALTLCIAMPPHAHALTKVELGCAKKVPGGAAKFASAVFKETSRCRNADISGKTVGACPNAANLAKIAKAQAKLLATVEKSCASSCSVSPTVACVSDVSCPPLPGTPDGREPCNAGVKNRPFDIRNLGYPGGLCPAVLGHGITKAADVAACVEPLVSGVAEVLVDSVYGEIVNATGVSSAAARCVAAAGKAAGKLTDATMKAVLRCRDAINKGKLSIDPKDCSTADVKTADNISKAVAKLDKALRSKCTAAAVQELDLCGAGIGATSGLDDAVACLTETARQLAEADADDPVPVLRAGGSLSLIEAVFPPAAVCGDGFLNQYAGSFRQIAEECDGAEDSACPGECLPPGDLFECTCAGVPRIKFLSDSSASELDTGWTGLSHNAGVNEGAGFMLNLTNCDCDEMTGAECTGSSSDPVCDTNGVQKPRCSWDPLGPVGCDEFGNGDGVNTDGDCRRCDDLSTDAGTWCSHDDDCGSLCYSASGVPAGACARQSDCGAGETCLGKCDNEAVCQRVTLSHPTPLSSGGNPTCLETTFRDDIFGTTNIVTGERDVFQLLRTTVFFGVSVARPCPVCGGVCVGGTQDGEICEGTCSGSGDTCRFDEECPVSETCTESTPECPGGACELELRCFGGLNDGGSCRIGTFTPFFGATSSDCPANPNANISGEGLEIPFYPATSESVSMPYNIPCTKTGFELFDCPCDADQGEATMVNTCLPTCDAGPELGIACAVGNSSGGFTVCDGGTNDGRACDEDADCPLGSCSANPTHCIGDPATYRFTCSTNADCGTGSCVDACPSGRCLPLCLPDPADSVDGLCAGGPQQYNCDGASQEFRICGSVQAAGGCSATCSVSGGACMADSECPVGESCQGVCAKAQLCEAGADGILGTPDDITGAGACKEGTRSCFLNPISGEGGDIFNGRGDPTHADAVTVYCIPRTTSPLINAASGIGGPGRLRSIGLNISNGAPTIP